MSAERIVMDLLSKFIKSLAIGILAGSGVALITSLFFPNLIDRLENVSYYARYKWEYSSFTKEDIREITDNNYGINIVDIDDRSMQKMGFYYNWDRSYHADLINSLALKFPAAIIFDIYFSNPEDINHSNRLKKIFARSMKLSPSLLLPEQIRNSILSSIDYDENLIDAVKNSGCTYLGICLSDEFDYEPFALSQIKSRMTMEWHDSLNPASTITLKADKRNSINEKKTIIDGIFPPLARAAKSIGFVNVLPNEDGVIREVPLLYRFGEFDPIYLPISLRTAASLFATPNDEIRFEPKKYIDIGKPLKIFRDKDSSFSVSYPNVTMAQIKAICDHAAEILNLELRQTLDITSLLIAIRDQSGNLSLEMNIPGIIPSELTTVLLKSDFRQILGLKTGETVNLSDDILMRKDSETDWILSAPFDIGEWYFSNIDLSTLSLLAFDSLPFVKNGERKLVFHDFSVKNQFGILTSSIPVFRTEALTELCRFGYDRILSIIPGTRNDFGKSVQIPLTENNFNIVTFFGPKGKPFPTYSYYDIVNNRVQGQFDGKIFFVGSTAPALFDIKPVPIEKVYPGVEVHASLMNSFLTNTFIRRLSPVKNFMLILIVGIIIGFISYMFKPLTGSILTLLSIFVYFLIAMVVFSNDRLWIELTRPIITIFLSFSIVFIFRYITEEKDRKFLQNTFKQYLSPELIDIMYKSRQLPILGGEEGVRTAFFTDIQGFSTFSEKLGSPTRLVELLNEYLSEMTDILLKHFGTLDKYEGDAIIAFFGAPMRMDDHADQACLAALDMQNSLGRLRKKWISEANKWPSVVHEMRMRIGINTGLITTGNMGSLIRKNYTMMGDAVNLAARLESAAKQYGVYTMISHNTFGLIKDRFETRQLDKIQVVGKSEPVTVYELISNRGALSREYENLLPLYNEGLEFFYAREWDRAIAKLTDALEHEPNRMIVPGNMSPSKKIISYCEMYKMNPPDSDWDGVTKLTSK